MRLVFIAFALGIAGCAPFSGYEPYVKDVVSPSVFAHDEGDCLKYAQGYSEKFNAASIGTAAAKGAASNAVGAVVNPWVPVLGAAGSASVALLDSVGVLTDKQRIVFLKCLDHRGERSRAYMVIDPNF